MLALGIACSGAYSGALYVRAWLVKPLVDDVLPHLSASGVPGLRDALASVPGLGGAAPAAEPAPSAVEETARAEKELRTRIEARARESLGLILLAALALVVLLPLAHFGQIYLVDWTLGRVLVDIQQELCRKLLSLPLGVHHGIARGEMLSRTINDATRAHAALDLVFAEVLQNTLALGLGVALLCWISWELALTVAIAAPLIALVIALFGRRIRKASKRRQESLAEVTQRLVQVLTGIKVIKAFRAEDAEAEHFERENLRYFRRNMKVVKNRALARTFVEALNNVIGVAVILVGMLLVLNHWGLSLGTLLSFALAMQVTYRPMKDLTKAWTQLQDAMPAADRFFELLDVPGERPDPPGAARFEGVRDAIRFEGVSFSYGREPVLRDVSLEVRAGETVAIVGRTGSGKTTLVDLLLRFFEPDRGSITIDGVDTRQLERRSLLDRVAVVTQEPFLFAGSIRDNIRYGAAGGDGRRRGAGGAPRPTCSSSSTSCPTASTPTSATPASASRAASASASRSPGRSCATPRSWCSTRPRAPSTRRASAPCRTRSTGSLARPHDLRDRPPARRRCAAPTASCCSSAARSQPAATHDELLGRSPLYRELVSLQGLGDAPEDASASA